MGIEEQEHNREKPYRRTEIEKATRSISRTACTIFKSNFQRAREGKLTSLQKIYFFEHQPDPYDHLKVLFQRSIDVFLEIELYVALRSQMCLKKKGVLH